MAAMTQKRTEWKRHAWSFNWATLEETCGRCGLVRLYRREMKRRDLASGGVQLRERIVEYSYTWKESSLGYDLPAPKACKPLPSGMRRVG